MMYPGQGGEPGMDPAMYYGQMPTGTPDGAGGYPSQMGMCCGYGGGMMPGMTAMGEQFGAMGIDNGRGSRGGRGGGERGGRGVYGMQGGYGMDARGMMGGKGAQYGGYGGRGAMGQPMGQPIQHMGGPMGYDDPRKRDEERDRERARSGVRGLRTGFVASTPGVIGAGTSAMSAEVARIKESVNPAHFDCNPKLARFFIIKSYSEDDVHKSIKYGIWASTDTGNRRLDAAYRESADRGPIYLFFSVNASGQFSGMAQMESAIDYTKKFGAWAQDKWSGTFAIKWIHVKDMPNSQFRHILLTNNENRPVTNSRDTQEILLEPGREMLQIFLSFKARTSVLDDFGFYDKRQELMEARVGGSGDPMASGMAAGMGGTVPGPMGSGMPGAMPGCGIGSGVSAMPGMPQQPIGMGGGIDPSAGMHVAGMAPGAMSTAMGGSASGMELGGSGMGGASLYPLVR